MAQETILLADNHLDFLETCRELLEREGYRVVTAPSAAAARKELGEGDTDLAILDIRLADDDDEKDITGLILAESLAPQIPKIILTGFQTTHLVREALRELPDGHRAAVDFIAKQEGAESLVTAVKDALEGQTTAYTKRAIGPFYVLKQRSPMAALISLLLAMGAGILAIAYGEPRWLIGTFCLSHLPCFLSEYQQNKYGEEHGKAEEETYGKSHTSFHTKITLVVPWSPAGRDD